MATVHYRACNLCEAICGLEIHLEGDRIRKIAGDPADPLSRGHICPKAIALQDLQVDPNRLRQPLRRTASGWETISWEAAFAEAAAGLARLQQTHGQDAVAIYLGNPNVHNLGAILFAPSLARRLKTHNRFSASSVDQLPHQLVAFWMFGHQFLLPIPDLDRTQFWLIFGGNPVVSNGSLMTAPGIKQRLRAIQARGGLVVVVDPRRTETAARADQHLFIRPGTDALLLLALLHTIFAEGLAAPGRLADHLTGLTTLQELAHEFPPEGVAEPTGVEAAAIRALARRFCAAESAVAYGRIGVSVQAFGSLCHWLINALNVVTGNLDRAGGAMFTRPAIDVLRRLRPGSYGRFKSRVRGLPEAGGELPVAVLAEEILTPGPGQIRGLVTVAGNPALSTPNGTQLERALASLEFMVAVDFYLNETTRHAHLILPPTFALERDHYDLVFNALAVRNTARYSAPLFAPGADTRHDWEILLELETRLARGAWTRLKAHAWRAWVHWQKPAGLLDGLLRLGPYGAGFLPFSRGLSLQRLRQAVHGVDLGPLEPCLPQRLFTADQRIQLAPQPLVRDLERLRAHCRESVSNSAASSGAASSGAASQGIHMLLIGRRDLSSNNSWMHNAARLVKGKERCTLLVHPSDAARLGISTGDRVKVRSRVGEIVAPVEITPTILPGVASLPHGWGHGRAGIELAVAAQHPGVSANDLTDELSVDWLSGNAALNGAPITIEPLPENDKAPSPPAFPT